MFFLKYIPLFLKNKDREKLHIFLEFLAESAKEIRLKGFEILTSHAPLNFDFTFLYELWKQIKVENQAQFNLVSGLHLSANNYAYMSGNPILRTSTDFTIECRANIINYGGAEPIKTIFGFNYPNKDFGIILSGNYLCGYMSGVNQTIIIGATPFNSGQWYHLLLSYSNFDNIARFYVNGELAGSGFALRFIYNYNNVLHFSSPDMNYYISGIIDEARFYLKCLDPVTIKEHSFGLYFNGSPYIYFDFNSQSGNYIFDLIQNFPLVFVGNLINTPVVSNNFYYIVLSGIHNIPELQYNVIKDIKTYAKDDYYYINQNLFVGIGNSGFLPSGIYFAPIVELKKDHFYNSWGKFLGLSYEEDNNDYLKKIRGLINIYFSPQNIMNFKRLVNVVAGAEVALDSGIVLSVSGKTATIQYNDKIVTHTIPSGLDFIISGGEQLIPYQPISNVCEVYDFIRDFYWPRYVEMEYVKKFLEKSDIPWEKIEKYIRYNLYLIQVNAFAVDYYPLLKDISYMESFLYRLNPPGKHFIYQIGQTLSENIYLSGSSEVFSFSIDITPDFSYNTNLLTGQQNILINNYDIINEGVPNLISEININYDSGNKHISGSIPFSGVFDKNNMTLK
ncbi:MAG: LamG domain-containing protein [Candidatus Aenigmatarchaeota archaeon]